MAFRATSLSFAEIAAIVPGSRGVPWGSVRWLLRLLNQAAVGA